MVLSDQSLENMDLGIPASMFTGICDIFREYLLLNISYFFILILFIWRNFSNSLKLKMLKIHSAKFVMNFKTQT